MTKTDVGESFGETSRFVYRHITPSDFAIISGFTLANDNGGFLADYLKSIALHDEIESKMRTYLVFDKNTYELAAYFSLKAGFVASHEKTTLLHREFDAVPGVELANFAVNGVYKRNHPAVEHIGQYVFSECILPVIYNAANYIGINVLYIFALPNTSLINYYSSLGFARLSATQERYTHRRIRPRYDLGCIFMYQMIM